jgi:hypothetical protein
MSLIRVKETTRGNSDGEELARTSIDALMQAAQNELHNGAFLFIAVFATPYLHSQYEVFLTGSIQSVRNAHAEISRLTTAGFAPIGFVALRTMPEWGKHAFHAIGAVMPGKKSDESARVALIRRLKEAMHTRGQFCRGVCDEDACRIAATRRAPVSGVQV